MALPGGRPGPCDQAWKPLTERGPSSNGAARDAWQAPCVVATGTSDGFVAAPLEEVQEVLRAPTARLAYTAGSMVVSRSHRVGTHLESGLTNIRLRLEPPTDQGLRAKPDAAIRRIVVPFAGPGNDDARATAASLAARLGVEVVDAGHAGASSDRRWLGTGGAQGPCRGRRRGPQRVEQRSQLGARTAGATSAERPAAAARAHGRTGAR